MKPKVALTNEFLNFLGGEGQVLFSMHRAYPQAPIYTLLSNPKFTDQYLPKAKIINSSLNRLPNFITKSHQIFLELFPIIVEQFDFSDYDVVISSCHSFIKGIITKPNTIHISYIHSPTRYIWDQSAEWIAQKKLNLFSPIINWRFNKLRHWDYLAADRVDIIIANSKTVAERIKKYYRREPYQVIYPPVPVNDFIPNGSVANKQDYFFTISRLVEYKRFDLAIKAFNELGLPLYVAGTGPEEKYLKSIAKDNIKFLGFISDEEKIKYLQGARAFIFPGEEDFGIVQVEAMAAGTPVIAYRKGGSTESIIANQTGLFFDQQKPEDLVRAVQKFVQMTPIKTEDCINRARQFDESVFQSQLRSVVEYAHQNKKDVLLKSTREHALTKINQNSIHPD